MFGRIFDVLFISLLAFSLGLATSNGPWFRTSFETWEVILLVVLWILYSFMAIVKPFGVMHTD